MSEKLKSACLALLMAALSGAMFFSFPFAERNGSWAHCVLNNWEQYGFSALSGQLVTNPGGHGALDDPQIYGGHKPHVARAAYFIGILSGSPGEDGWLFHVLLSVLVGMSIWLGFGKTSWAALLSICTIISPGFIRTPLQLDTLAIPVLLGIPVLFIASKVFFAKQRDWRKTALFFVLLAFYAQINWTTALSVFVICSYLVASKKLSLKSLAVFVAISGVAVCFVLITSLLHKQSASRSFMQSASLFFNSYLFGAGGYGGLAMDWITALRRIAVANIIGLMPLLVGLVFVAVKLGLTQTLKPLHLLPLAASIVCILILRNYFATHPWMAAPIIILGLIATMKIFSDSRLAKHPAANSSFSLFYCVLIVVFSLIYAWGIIKIFAINAQASDSIARMVKTHTQRDDLIFVQGAVFRDPAAIGKISDLCDRLVMSGYPAALNPVNNDLCHFVLTTGLPPEGYIKIANTSAYKDASSQTLSMLLDLYRTTISRRTIGDSPLPVKTYTLLVPAAH